MALSRSFTPDLVIKNLDGDPIAVVEVKGGTNVSADFAIEIRRNTLESGLPRHIPYFLVLSQDVGYLWKDSEENNSGTSPTYEFPMNKVIRRYSTKEPSQRLFETELEFVMLQWLTNLSTKPQEAIDEPEKTLARAGFSDAIKEAMVLIEEKL